MTASLRAELSLPLEVLGMVCDELGHKQDLGALFNCAVSSKQLAQPAIPLLYRVYNYSNTEGGDADFSKPQTFQARKEQQIRTMSKWALLWKSVIRSSIGKTAYPYAQFLKSLDLRNFTYLLEDTLFRDYGMEDFFAGDMDQFLKAQETPIRKRTRKGNAIGTRIDIPVVLDLVGESITKYVSVAATKQNSKVALDDIAPGDISSAVLPRWIGRLSQLRSMTLWDGAVLNEDAATAINTHCPRFNDLTFFRCSREAADSDLAAFFGALKSDSLESLNALSAEGIGPETLLALNNHSKSLRRLKINGLRNDAMKKLSLLQDCLALETLALKDYHGLVNLEATENDVFIEVVEWLKRCQQLKELSLDRFVSAPEILTQICLNSSTQLRKLEVVNSYSLTDSQAFHRALSQQTTLEALRLTADPEAAFRDDIDTLVSSVCQLSKLTYLDLCVTSDYFRTAEIRLLATNLKALEVLKFTGYDITDDVWYSISGLHKLRALEIQAVTSFSADGILSYISTLQPTNQGLNLLVANQNADQDISDVEKAIIQDSIAEKVDGKFEYELFKEAGSEEDSDSD
ncbi:hypothetical protein D0Z07_5163 [Hyphodiscus hymeniophilus]|uniref:RNI-like protein n=1 Tax=Hyphodiscus hymeniophilus TaxID=353542 RepID=A0A9P6VIZ3_9HELO|nr:hypothetical protein D0Z07_5163 [Hyphodiscus hymeniophilus]